MKICGVSKLTLLDYPEHIACTIFTGACNFRCPYCHNPELVLHSEECGQIDEKEIYEFLESRKKRLEGICITGGEPTLQKDIITFIKNIKEKGYLVKLDTNGYMPEKLEEIIKSGYIDMVAMDIKNCKSEYAKTVGIKEEEFCIAKIEQAVEIIKKSKIKHEFRSTIVKELHTRENIIDIAKWLNGDDMYFLQNFRENEELVCGKSGIFHSFEENELKDILKDVRVYMSNARVRGEEW